MNSSTCSGLMNNEERLLWAVLCFAFCALAFLIPGLAMSAGWEIDPVRVELTSQQKTAAVTVKNNSDQPTSIQIHAVAWTQVDGKDIYNPTDDLLVSPPIVTIAPKSEQIIRVALRRQADSSKELAYRITMQELPPSLTPNFSGVQVALRIGLPVFVQSVNGEAAAKLIWKVSRMPDSKLKVGVQNQGNAHIQISDFALYNPGGKQSVSGEAGSSYILAGQSHEWLLLTNPFEKITSKHLHLKAYTDTGNVDTVLVLGRL